MKITKKISKTAKEGVASFYSAIWSKISPFIEGLKHKIRWNARVRAIRIRILRNPKPFGYGCIGVTAFLLLLNILPLFGVGGAKNEPLISTQVFEDAQQAYPGINFAGDYYSSKVLFGNEIERIKNDGLKLATEIDSLRHLKNMTEEDSVSLNRKSAQLQEIVEFFNVKTEKI